MSKKSRLGWALAIAVGVGMSTSAMAQFRVTTADGRMNEANNRIGSGGSNVGVQVNNGPVQGNLLVTGDVTGGREFRGNIPYTSPMSFSGPTASDLTDRFIRSSSGAPVGGISQNNAQVVQPFWGVGNATPPPASFGNTAQNPFTGAYRPAAPLTRAPGDLRLGEAINNAPVSSSLPRPGSLVMPGPVDSNTQTSTMITASPLFGVKQLNPTANPADQDLLNSTLGIDSTTGVRIDPGSLRQMRDQLRQQKLQNGSIDQQNQNDTNTNGPLPAAMESPQNAPLGSAIKSGQSGSSDALNGSLSTGESSKLKLLTSNRLQSSQYDELEKRLAQYRSVQEQNDTASARQYNKDVADKKLADAKKTNPGGAPGTPGAMGMAARAGGTPGATGNAMGTGTGTNVMPPMPAPTGGSGAAGTANSAPAGAPQVLPAPSNGPRPAPPLKINSLADGVQAKQLADVLKDAENLTRTGKYNSALEQYDMADQLAPNSPLVLLGRANVELGRTYYTRAETYLRQAFMQSNALLMGQYDLQGLLGQDRLTTVVSDLKSLADREQKQPLHVFLLAYIAYNTGHEAQAAAYLDLAEKRAGANDPLYPLVRKYWSLPTPDMNK